MSTELYDPSPFLHVDFFRQAERQPHALAVTCGPERVTYGELADRARRIATALLDLRCRPGEVVAINAVRSSDTVAALLGILDAGAAYLPIDAEWPETRIRIALADCRVRFAVSKSDSLVAANVSKVVDPSRKQASSSFAASPQVRISPEDLAYVIFTSGSTGTPKGVMISHAAAMNTIRDITRRFGVCERDRIFALSSFAFDLSVYDIFGVLGAGGTVILPTDAQARDPAAWSRLVRDERATIWNSVPALMELLLSYLRASDQDIGTNLRLALLSGDWISVGLPARLRMVSPDTEIVSLGGATEASIWSIAYPIREVDPAWSRIPYGRPLVNQQFYILNEEGQPCEVGQVGELYIGGAGVALGYCNKPQLTFERFVADPWSEVGSASMYRTGDFGRFGSDGTIEFLGRIDDQVKVNGHRIELGEVESRLSQCAGVGQCAVAAVGESAAIRRLVAYIVPSHPPVSRNEILTELRRHLPAAMVPSALVIVPALPMTANGKVDRGKLQAIKTSIPITAGACHGQVIDRISAIWREVLHLDIVGVHDNFFDLGGDSLAAVLLFIRLEEQFENAPPLATLLEHPTIAGLARLLGPDAAPKKSLLVRLQPNGDRRPLFCVPGADGQLLVYRHLAATIGNDQPLYGVQPRGLDGSTPDGTIEESAARGIRELRRVQPSGPYRLVGFSTGGVIAFEMARQFHKMGERVGALLLIDSFPGYPPAPSLMSRLSVHARHLASLPHRDWPKHVRERAKVARIKLRGVLRRAPAEQRWTDGLKLTPHAARVALSNLQALKMYEPKPYPGNAVLLRASIQHRLRQAGDDLGWKSLCSTGFQVVRVPGTHADCLTPPHVTSLAQAVRAQLGDGPS
jgi:amino acid adenylation domain-containing protein